ncbi:probable conserved transmembrane protein [Pseudonocardia sp. N23]|nr:probable conserved transmembrane protein [Pseudonocardia sp. N23]
MAVLAAGAEIWRYVLLVLSRSGALSAGVVSASDMLVAGAGWLVTVLGLLTGLLVVAWSVRAARAGAERGGRVASRSGREIVVGWLVPVVNLSVPGSVLAEIEHGALDRPADARPRPSRQLLVWWAVWAVGVVLAITVFALSFRTGVQARADGVVLHAVVDLVAAAVAVLTARLVSALSMLLGPVRAPVRETLVTVRTGD